MAGRRGGQGSATHWNVRELPNAFESVPAIVKLAVATGVIATLIGIGAWRLDRGADPMRPAPVPAASRPCPASRLRLPPGAGAAVPPRRGPWHRRPAARVARVRAAGRPSGTPPALPARYPAASPAARRAPERPRRRGPPARLAQPARVTVPPPDRHAAGGLGVRRARHGTARPGGRAGPAGTGGRAGSVQVPVPAALAAAGQEEQVGVGVVLTAPTANPTGSRSPPRWAGRGGLAEQAQEAQQLVRQPGQQPQTVQPQRQGRAPGAGSCPSGRRSRPRTSCGRHRRAPA